MPATQAQAKAAAEAEARRRAEDEARKAAARAAAVRPEAAAIRQASNLAYCSHVKAVVGQP